MFSFDQGVGRPGALAIKATRQPRYSLGMTFSLVVSYLSSSFRLGVFILADTMDLKAIRYKMKERVAESAEPYVDQRVVGGFLQRLSVMGVGREVQGFGFLFGQKMIANVRRAYGIPMGYVCWVEQIPKGIYGCVVFV